MHPPQLLRRAAAVAAVALASIAPAAAAQGGGAGGSATRDPVPVQLLSITDLHGYFGDHTMTVPGARAGEPRQTVGGGAYLATHLERLADGQRNSILFSAGDDFSGWPDETEFFWNEPTIEYLNALGLEFSTVGNHEMDRGLPFLRHIEQGTCEGRPDDDLCFPDSTGARYAGADFRYYSANLVGGPFGLPVQRPFHVRWVSDGRGGRLPVGFVHATTRLFSEEQMSYTPRGVRAIDEAKAINASVKLLRGLGVRAIVAVIHEGFSQRSGAGYDDCDAPFGPVVDDLNPRISADVDAIVTGHWHATVNCTLPDPAGAPRPIVEAGNHGSLISEITLQLDPRNGEVLRDRTRSLLHPNTQDVPRHAEAQRIADHWRGRLPARAGTPVATVTGDLLRAPGDGAEATLPNVAADAFLWAANEDGRADLAVAMPSILRRDIRFAADPANAADADGRVLFGEVAVGTVYDSGIGIGIVRGTVTGAEVDALLESQWQIAADGTARYRNMAVSGNVSYRYDTSKPVGERVDPADVRIDGRPLRPRRSYRVATLANNFFAKNATPGVTALFGARAQDRSAYNGGDALWRYLEARSPLAPPATDRGTPLGAG